MFKTLKKLSIIAVTLTSFQAQGFERIVTDDALSANGYCIESDLKTASVSLKCALFNALEITSTGKVALQFFYPYSGKNTTDCLVVDENNNPEKSLCSESSFTWFVDKEKRSMGDYYETRYRFHNIFDPSLCLTIDSTKEAISLEKCDKENSNQVIKTIDEDLLF